MLIMLIWLSVWLQAPPLLTLHVSDDLMASRLVTPFARPESSGAAADADAEAAAAAAADAHAHADADAGTDADAEAEAEVYTTSCKQCRVLKTGQLDTHQLTGGPTNGTARHLLFSEPGSG